jgi:myo-inositol-1(or 4)-monophosphatase
VGAGASGRLRVSAAEASEENLLEVAIEAARLGGGLLAARAARGVEADVASKSTPTDLVSEADLASQRTIRGLLAERRPDDGFLGEEEEEDEQGSSGLRWIVDPLDGTVNYLFGIPQWSVSVAVADARGTVAGAVYDPNRDELFTATRGGPALLDNADRSLVLVGRAVDPHAGQEDHESEGTGGEGLSSAMVATGLAYDADVRAAQGEVLARLVAEVRDVRRFGSAALDLAWTAVGRYDAYYERAVKVWDVAAGRLICERAGLKAMELAGRPGLPWGILVARPGLAGALAEIVT